LAFTNTLQLFIRQDVPLFLGILEQVYVPPEPDCKDTGASVEGLDNGFGCKKKEQDEFMLCGANI